MSVISTVDFAGLTGHIRRIGLEARKADEVRRESGFYDHFLSGANVLDIGYRGRDRSAQPVVPQATGVDLDYPGYDGKTLPFADETQHAVFASHCLQFIDDPQFALREWYRVLKTRGFLLVFVPHKYLYERRPVLPSRWSTGNHKRFYTPASLIAEVEAALPLNGFRIRHFADNDMNFDYQQSIWEAPRGCYEIELVVQKIERPSYSDRLELSPAQRAVHKKVIETLRDRIVASLDSPETPRVFATPLAWIPSFIELRTAVAERREVSDDILKAALKPVLERVTVNNDWYLTAYPDIRVAIEKGTLTSAREHFVEWGYFEGRMSDDVYGTWLDSASSGAQ